MVVVKKVTTKKQQKEFLEKQWYNEVMGDFNEFDYLQEGKYE